jgi:peptide/nickel transport system substrate-binding protein
MRTRSSRRTTKLGVAALVSFALVAAACGGSDDDSSDGGETTDAVENTDATDGDEGGDTEATDAPVVTEAEIEEDTIEDDTDPVPGGTLRFGLEADVDGLNPTSSALSSPGLMMAGTVFDTVAVYDTDGVAVPYLAESIEPVDGDLSKWQVKLREGILFHDGTPLDSAALQFNFEAAKGDPLVGNALQPYYPAEGATEIIDDLTLQYNLLEPNALFAGGLTTQLGFIASPTWLAAALEDPTLNQEPVGTGAFVFDTRSADSVTRMVRNDSWWNGSAYLDAVEFVPVPDPDTRNDLLFNGDLQGLQTSNQASVGDLQDRADEFQNIIDETGPESFAMINSAAAPFDDIRARQALTFATPLQTYRDLIGLGISRAADQMFTPESPNFNPDVTQEGDMPDEAIALATEYCAERGTEENPVTGGPTCTDGKINIELQWSGPSVIQTRIAEILDEGWSSAFNVTFDELAQDDHIQQTALGLYNVNTWRQFGEVDPISDKVYMMCRNIGGISLNFPKFCSEERDALINEAQTIADAEGRVPMWQSIVQDMHDAYTYIFTTHTIWDDAFDNSVRGVCDRTAPDGTVALCTHRGRPWFDSVWIAE